LRRADARIFLSVDMRYVGQAYEVKVAWDKNFIRRFHRLHEARFGHSDPEKEIEVVTLRVRIEGKRRVRTTRPLPTKRGRGRQAFVGFKKIYFPHRFARCPTYQREELHPGDRIRGPAVIYEFSSTTVVPPGWDSEVDGHANLHLRGS
jgi:N-methylhydantoinase A